MPLKKVGGDGNCILEYVIGEKYWHMSIEKYQEKKKQPQGPSCVVGNGKPVQHDRLVFCRYTLDSVYCKSSDVLVDGLKDHLSVWLCAVQHGSHYLLMAFKSLKCG